MSVVVMGMEMPAKCCGCDAEQHDESFYGDEFNHVCPFIYKGYTGYIRDRGRLNDCPLRPLPEKHGRLIDIDALPQGRVEWEDIDHAPIVVEAEE